MRHRHCAATCVGVAVRVACAALALEDRARAEPDEAPAPADEPATSPAAAPPTPSPPTPSWPWIGPGLQATTIAGSTGLALANGFSFGRYALDAGCATLGTGIGVIGAFLLTKYGNHPDPFVLVLGLPAVVALGAFGGVALGEAIRSRGSSFPARTAWPATGGFVVGVVVDLAAFGVSFSSSPPNDRAAITTAILSAFTLGTATVGGYSITR